MEGVKSFANLKGKVLNNFHTIRHRHMVSIIPSYIICIDFTVYQNVFEVQKSEYIANETS